MGNPSKSRLNDHAAITALEDGERKKAEAEALLFSIGEGAIVTDANGRVSHINQAALKILRIKERDIIGKWYPGEVIAEDEKGHQIVNIERPIVEVFMTGATVFRKLYYRRKDGTRVAVALTVSPVLLNGKPIGAIEVFRDITDEVNLDRAKDEFISLASHQLRTPATGVKQYIGMLLEGYAGELTSEQKRFAQIAYESNDRQLKIIDDILKIATADSGKLALEKKRTNLVPLIESVIRDHASKLSERDQTVTFDPSVPSLHAMIDKDSMRMVLDNLLDNAHKYTHPGKNITISLKKNTRTIQIAIKDEGIGISEEDFDKLFKKFSRLSNSLSISAGGTGVGLYWVKKVVELHNGIITVSSKPDIGTTFSVKLPL